MAERKIIHVDMDAFFASVEQLDFPELKGKPIVVGGQPNQRSVVSAASYEARKFGIHSAMPMNQAVKRCSKLIIQPIRMHRYAEVSKQIFEIFERFSPQIEPLSIDEAFIDVTGCEKLFGPAPEIGRKIKILIADELGLKASVGIAPNKFLAKVASDLDKPDGFVVITEENKLEATSNLAVGRIWGVGKVTQKILTDYGIHTFAQLRNTPVQYLQRLIGNFAETLIELANGIDYREVTTSHTCKSISSEETFPQDITSKDAAVKVLLSQIEEVSLKLRFAGLKTKTIQLKLRYNDFTTITRSRTLKFHSDSTETLWNNAQEIFELWYRQSFRPLRLIGFGVSNLADKNIQLELFRSEKEIKQEKLDKTVDSIKNKFGFDSLKRGSTL